LHTPSIIVGTPVRLLEMYNDGANIHMDLTRLQMVIIDEVDRIVDVASRRQKFTHSKKKVHLLPGQALVGRIVKERANSTKQMIMKVQQAQKDSYPGKQVARAANVDLVMDAAKARKLQVIVSSATVNNPMRQLMKHNGWMKDPVIIDHNQPHTTPRMSHSCYYIDSDGFGVKVKPEAILTREELALKEGTPVDEEERKWFPAALADDDDRVVEEVVHLVQTLEVKNGFIFANSATSISRLVMRLQSYGLRAEKLFNIVDYESSTVNYDEKYKSPFDSVKNGDIDFIVCTEHEARGLDLPSMGHVFILGLPSSPASYLHMAGRCTRTSNPGNCITLLGGERYVERYLKQCRLLRLTIS
jgi:superfamily II DNA/RNA helicase